MELQVPYSICNSILNHTPGYIRSKGKLLIHLCFDFRSLDNAATPGEIIRYHRVLKGLSTRELAEKVGIVPATLILYENDKHPVKHKTAVAIAVVLEIDHIALLDEYGLFVDYPFNEKLQEMRKSLSLNQSEMAEKIGVSQTCYSSWERAARTPRKSEYKRIMPLLKAASIK